MATTPKSKDALLGYLRVQKDADRKLFSVLARSASDVDKQIKKITGTNVGAVIRREQLIAAKKQMYGQMSIIMREAGLITRAGQLDAAAAAIKTFQEYEKVLFTATGAEGEYLDAYLKSAQQTSRVGIDAAIQRIQGTSYIPLSRSVYKAEQFSRGIVDRYVESALTRGLSAREFAKGARDLIDPNVRGGVSYAAERLARTEINNAHHAISAQKARESPFVTSSKWNLSGSHPTPDECNQFADEVHYTGGEPGNFKPKDIPIKPHPNCLCYVTPNTISDDEFLDAFFAGDYDPAIDKQLKASGLPVEKIEKLKPTASLAQLERSAKAAGKKLASLEDNWKGKISDLFDTAEYRKTKATVQQLGEEIRTVKRGGTVAAKKAPIAKPAAKPVVKPQPRKLSEGAMDFDFEAIRKADPGYLRWDSHTGIEDIQLKEIWRQNGFDGKPKIVSAEEFNKNAYGLVPDKNKQQTMFRSMGMTEEQGKTYAKQLMEGDEPFAGLGFIGNGTYFSPDRQVAAQFGEFRVRAYLDKSAKGIKPDDLLNKKYEFMDEWYKLNKDADFELQDAMLKMTNDPGRLASYLGYDYIDSIGSYMNEIVVLNRTKLVFCEI